MTVLSHIRGFLESPRRWWLVVGVLAVLVVYVLARGDAARMWRSFLSADWRWVAVAMVLLLGCLVLHSVALLLIVRAYGGVRPRLRDTFSSTSIGLLANAIVPVRVGGLLNPYVLFLLLRRRGAAVPFATTLGMTVTEQLFSASTFVLLALLFVSTLSAPAWALPALLTCAVLLGLGLTGAALLQAHRRRLARDGDAPGGARRGRDVFARAAAGPAVLAPAAGRSGDGASASAAPRPGWRTIVMRAAPHFLDSQRILSSPLSALLVAAVQAAAWVVQLAAALAVLHAFHLGGAGWRAAALVLVLTNLIGILPLTPGNVGTFQVAATAALAAYGVAPGPALAFALGLQGIQLLVAIVAGLVSLSLQNLALAEVALRSRHAAHVLHHGEPSRPPADSPAGG